LSNPVHWQNWMVAYLGYTLRMRTLFRGWPIMVNDTHTRRRRSFVRGQDSTLAIGDERGCTACLHIIKVWSHHAAPTPITLAGNSMANRLQAGRSGLEMSSWPGTVIAHWWTSSSSRVWVSKASAFRFVSRTVCSLYPPFNLWQPSISSRHCMDLEHSY